MTFDMGNNIEIRESLEPRDESVFLFKIYTEHNTVLRFKRFCSQTIIISLFHRISYISIWLQAAKQCKTEKCIKNCDRARVIYIVNIKSDNLHFVESYHAFLSVYRLFLFVFFMKI